MGTKDDLDNHSRQLDPENDAYWQSRGEPGRPDDWQERLDDDNYEYSQDDLDNHSRQYDPENDAYWQSRGTGQAGRQGRRVGGSDPGC